MLQLSFDNAFERE